MRRAGFTMIELIFVIVILGILASVALPKLIGIKESADEGLLKGFVGTLNRTVGASKWSQSLMNGTNGSVTALSIDINDTEFPSSFADSPTLTLSNCADSNATVPTDSNIVGSTSEATTSTGFSIVCKDGSDSQSPKFWYTENTTVDANATFSSNKLKI